MILSQKQIRDLVVPNVTTAQSAGATNIFICVLERDTYYKFVSSYPVSVNGYSVLSTGRNGFSRWVAISGRYAKSYAKYRIPTDEYAEVFPFEQLATRNQPLTMEENGRLVLREGACFYGG